MKNALIELENIDKAYLLKADVKLKYNGEIVEMHNDLDVIRNQNLEELIDDFDSRVWSYIRTIDNQEAKDILARVAKEIMDDYLGEEE